MSRLPSGPRKRQHQAQTTWPGGGKLADVGVFSRAYFFFTLWSYFLTGFLEVKRVLKDLTVLPRAKTQLPFFLLSKAVPRSRQAECEDSDLSVPH